LLALGASWEYRLNCGVLMMEGRPGIRALGKGRNCRAAFGRAHLEARNTVEMAMRGVFILRLLCWGFERSDVRRKLLCEATPDFVSAL
jgi:hypothetical protein